MKKKFKIILAIIGILIVLSIIGSFLDDSGSSMSPTDVTKKLFYAISESDGEQIRKYTTSELGNTVETLATVTEGNELAASYMKIMYGKFIGEKIEGDNATVSIKGRNMGWSTELSPAYMLLFEHLPSKEANVKLVKVNGEWKVGSLSSSKKETRSDEDGIPSLEEKLKQNSNT